MVDKKCNLGMTAFNKKTTIYRGSGGSVEHDNEMAKMREIPQFTVASVKWQKKHFTAVSVQPGRKSHVILWVQRQNVKIPQLAEVSVDSKFPLFTGFQRNVV